MRRVHAGAPVPFGGALGVTGPTVAVGGIAFDNAGRLLMIQRAHPPARGKWTVPGGRVEHGESLRDACQREVLEETGLVVTAGALVDVLDGIAHNDDGTVKYHFVIIAFLLRVEGGTLAAGDDASAARFVTSKEMATLPLTRGLEQVLQKAHAVSAGETNAAH